MYGDAAVARDVADDLVAGRGVATRRQARQEIADHPDLPRLVADGCARVGDKWEPYYGELLEARCWAINLAKNYAADEGITFVLLDDEHDPNK